MPVHDSQYPRMIKQLPANTDQRSLGDITWAYAANNLKALETALSNPDIGFIEVDVSLSANGVPIAAHPPAITSDLTIPMLLDKVRNTGKGIKFDFKNIQTVEPVVQKLVAQPLSQAVILNADILAAYGADEPVIDTAEFINGCRLYKEGIFSLGWTTNANSDCHYTYENVTEMLTICADLGYVTFPVRATMLPRSWNNIKHLLERPDSSLTIWESGTIDHKLKEWLRKHTNPDNCFYEVIF